MAKKIVCGVYEGEGADEVARDAFSLEPRPGPGRVDLHKVLSTMELVGELEVVEDAEYGLNDSHAWTGCYLGQCYQRNAAVAAVQYREGVTRT